MSSKLTSTATGAGRAGGVARGRRGLRRAHAWRLRRRLQRFLAEQIAELVLAELRRARQQIDPRDLALFRPLPGVEQQGLAVRRPGNRIGEHVGHEAHRTRGLPVERRDVGVRELLLPRREVGNPAAVRRPRDVSAGGKWRLVEPAAHQQPILPCRDVQHPQLLVAANEREVTAVGREPWGVVTELAARETRFGLGPEVVLIQVRHAVAARRVHDRAAVRRPDDVGFGGGRPRETDGVAAVLCGRGKHLAARHECDLAAVGRQRQ
jgi:hypothetical protein